MPSVAGRCHGFLALEISRRELGMAALAGTMLAQAQEAKIEDRLPDQLFDQALDPVYWTRMRHDSAPLRMAFRAENRKQAEAWQKRLRVKLTELLGGFPAATTPLNVSADLRQPQERRF